MSEVVSVPQFNSSKEGETTTQTEEVQPPRQNSAFIDIPRSAYIHIPFCRRRCYYCDFPISVVGNEPRENSTAFEQYIKALCQEINATPVGGKPLETLFFGGGTPSLLNTRQLEEIIATVRRHLGIVENAEISIEMDPGTFSLEKLRGYQRAGINRISLGVQTFQDQLLEVCGRSHTSDDIFAAVDLIRQVDIPNFSLDLISGLPHQTIEQWQDSLSKAVAIAPTHLSGYDLVLEPDTSFGRQYQPGDQPLPTDDTSAEMYRLAQQKLTEAGYQHYEVSNYAQPGYQCRHNRTYWQNQPYYGFGMGAASYVGKQRFTRPRTRREYYAWVEKLVAAGGKLDLPLTSTTDELLETLMLGFRLAEGVDLSQISRQFGEKRHKQILTCLQPYYKQGWVETRAEDGTKIEAKSHNLADIKRISLSDPEGFLFSNVVLARLFEQLG